MKSFCTITHKPYLYINSFVGKIMARSDKNKAKLREELDGITTLNLFLNSTNILEKLLWVTIAVLGTLFIYDIVFAQLTYWQMHPDITVYGRKKLAEIEPPAITLCSSGLQKYGLIERMANYIDPKKDVPHGLLAIRNEGLTLEFLKFRLKPAISDTDIELDFCKLTETSSGILKIGFSANHECQVSTAILTQNVYLMPKSDVFLFSCLG